MQIYNWLLDLFDNHSHCTVFREELSTLFTSTPVLSRGQPWTSRVTTGDLVAAVPGNSMWKYADDTYIIIPANNETTRHAELTNVQKWAARNNLKLNCSNSTEVIFRDHS